MRFCVSKGFHLCSLQQPADVPEPRHYVQALLPWLCFPRSPWLRIMAINEVSTFKYCRKLFQFLPATGWVAQSCCVPVPVFLWPVQKEWCELFYCPPRPVWWGHLQEERRLVWDMDLCTCCTARLASPVLLMGLWLTLPLFDRIFNSLFTLLFLCRQLKVFLVFFWIAVLLLQLLDLPVL